MPIYAYLATCQTLKQVAGFTTKWPLHVYMFCNMHAGVVPSVCSLVLFHYKVGSSVGEAAGESGSELVTRVIVDKPLLAAISISCACIICRFLIVCSHNNFLQILLLFLLTCLFIVLVTLLVCSVH